MYGAGMTARKVTRKARAFDSSFNFAPTMNVLLEVFSDALR
jgi:hypothetical protein